MVLDVFLGPEGKNWIKKGGRFHGFEAFWDKKNKILEAVVFSSLRG